MLKLDTTCKIVARLVTSPAINQCHQPEESKPYKPGQDKYHRLGGPMFEHDAEQLYRFIMGNLPSGTYDRLIAKLLAWEAESGRNTEPSYQAIRACLSVFESRFSEKPRMAESPNGQPHH